MPSAYLDHAASTPLRPEALEAMLPFLAEHHGNPSGRHGPARTARRAVDRAREAVAALAGCAPGEVVFTSGGTEADATALAGTVARRPGRPVVGAIDHHAVLDGAAAAARRVGTDVGVVAVDARGALDPSDLAEVLGAGPVAVVAVGLANNELGTIQPLEVVAAARDDLAPGAPLLTDAVQAGAWLDLPTVAARADLLALSAHKLGGPKGVGALVVRSGVELEPLVHGGGQERGRRSGTPNVAGIVGFGAAAEVVLATRAATATRVAARRDRLADGLRAALPGAVETVAPDGDRSHLLPGHLHLCVPGVPADELLFLLDQEGISASAGASCSSGATEPSHVLAALGVAPDVARGALRLSLGWSSTDAEVDHALAAIPAAVARLAGP